MDSKKNFSTAPQLLARRLSGGCGPGALTGLFLVLMAALTLIPATASGMGQGMKVRSAQEIVSDMKNRLMLSPEQEARVLPIITDYARQRDQMLKSARENFRGRGGGGRGDFMDKFRELRNDTEKRLSEVLTDSQMRGYAKLQDEYREKFRENARGMGGRGSRGMGGF